MESMSWPGSRDPGLMYFYIHVYFSMCSVLVVLSPFSSCLPVCVIYVCTPGCFGSPRDCDSEVFLCWKLPHLPADGLIKRALFKSVAELPSALDPKVKLISTTVIAIVWKPCFGRDCLVTILCFVCSLGIGSGVCFSGAEPQVGNWSFWSCCFQLVHSWTLALCGILGELPQGPQCWDCI